MPSIYTRWEDPHHINTSNLSKYNLISQTLTRRKIYSKDQLDQLLLLNFELPSLDEPDFDDFVHEINNAKDKQSSVVVFGDYDVDGISSTKVMLDGLKMYGLNVRYYIPSRSGEGYGLKEQSIAALKEEGCDVLVTVDCGIKSINEVEYAKLLGMKVIITDHHLPGSTLPAADVVVNPQLLWSDSDNKEIAGVATAWLCLKALIGDDADKYLDLVALGTLADVMPLSVPLNRYLVRRGLDIINTAPSVGVKALMEVLGLNNSYSPPLVAETVVFKITPCLNAASRMSDPKIAFDLLNSSDYSSALKIARELNELNQSRKTMQETYVSKAKDKIEDDEIFPIIHYYDPEIPKGILGLIASNLSERYRRPVFVTSGSGDYLWGSSRVPRGYNAVDILDQCCEYLEEYGGHSSAAGFKVKSGMLDDFSARIVSAEIPKVDVRAFSVNVDVFAENFTEIVDAGFQKEFMSLEPFGAMFSYPVISSRNIKVVSVNVFGKSDDHCKLVLEDSLGNRIEALLFFCGAIPNKIKAAIDICYTIHMEKKPVLYLQGVSIL